MLDTITTTETRDVTFEVRVSNQAAEVQWFKEEELIAEDTEKYKIKKQGRMRSLTVVKTRPDDIATYKAVLPKDTTKGKLKLIGMYKS